ncbi:aromatic/alkene monooxygenase hydroxylase subunit beta [Moraxella canis]|uniref:Aromatic/alkene monooxygenase hydroxylase subunit beta n=1 Tax=Moraxella canis TaxID=90239 RepID=A0ABZ0WWX4_9GAMM|nr:aromatic/alkene monooxygenase hydroxylase subunit beta [Moraxella canis]WQE03744.1 aromatic/alkene monooxygenase hydroxylase subunit beta [Moraxella canis]
MSLEIKTATLEPVRHTYAYIERRFGPKPATRYQEASFDIQGTTNFHYRPLWKPEKTLNDPTHSQIGMQDWYALKDPRQFYYGAYVQNRAKMQDLAENSYAFFEKRHLVDNINEDVKQTIIKALVPFRYVEQTANLHMMSGSAYGYGTTLTQACIFGAMDRLGMAQYLSRIGLLLDANTAKSLNTAKEVWLNDEAWQPLRRLCEFSLTEDDWFKLFLYQNLLIDSMMIALVYQCFDSHLGDRGVRDIAMLTEFMSECLSDLRKWSDSVLKSIVADNEKNKVFAQSCLDEYLPQVKEAFGAWSTMAMGVDNSDIGVALIEERAKRIGLTV